MSRNRNDHPGDRDDAAKYDERNAVGHHDADSRPAGDDHGTREARSDGEIDPESDHNLQDDREPQRESGGESAARDAAAGLDHATATFAGTSQVEDGAAVGYTEGHVEERAQATAEAEGFTLYRNPDGSHTAIDESLSVSEVDADLQAPGASQGRTGAASAERRHRRPAPEKTDLDHSEVVRILRGSRYVMLTTALADGKLLAHPMVPQEVTDDADVWFFIGLDGDQATALQGNPNVNLTVSEAGNWLSVSGTVEFVDDRSKIDELWSDDAAAWFEAGRNDPTLGLIRVLSDSAQHWGLTGGRIAGLAQMIKAKVTGQRTEGGSATTEL